MKEKVATNHATLAEQAHAQRSGVEETLAAYKTQNAQLEEKFQLSAQEINKGNQIIQHLQSSCKNLKAKMRLQATALGNQEKSFNQR